MSNFGKVTAGAVVEVIVADQTFIDQLPDAVDWLELPYGVGIGWNYDGQDWTDGDGNPPPPEPETPLNYILSGPEWVERFTDQEWKWLKQKRAEATAAGERLDQMMDAIRWTNSIDVASPNMDEFYDWLLNQGLPGGQTRIDELRASKTQ